MNKIQYPKWITESRESDDERASARMEYLIRRAAVEHNREGNIVQLAAALGVTPQAFYASIARGSMTLQLATAMELLLGSHIAPKYELASKETVM